MIPCDRCHIATAKAEIIIHPKGGRLYLCGHHTRASFGDHVDPGTDYTIIYLEPAEVHT